MDTPEAIQICNDWFAYIESQRAKSVEVQKLATMARNGQQAEAQRRLRQIDSTPTVYDGARLEPAVRHLVALAGQVEEAATLITHASGSPLSSLPDWGDRARAFLKRNAVRTKG